MNTPCPHGSFQSLKCNVKANVVLEAQRCVYVEGMGDFAWYNRSPKPGPPVGTSASKAFLLDPGCA